MIFKILYYIPLISFASISHAQHFVQDSTLWALQQKEIAETVNLVKTAGEQLSAITKVYNNVRDVYEVIGDMRRQIENLGSTWERIKRSWSFDDIEDLDGFMRTADRSLSRWGIQPATSGLLGDAMAQSKIMKRDAQHSKNELGNAYHNYSMNSVMGSIFKKRTYTSTSSGGFWNLFAEDSIREDKVEDAMFAQTDTGNIMVKQSDGSLSLPSAEEQMILTQKTQSELFNSFSEYASQQAILDAETKKKAADIANDTTNYSSDLTGVTQKVADLEALQVAATSDTITAINQNTTANMRSSELMMELARIEREADEAKRIEAALTE